MNARQAFEKWSPVDCPWSSWVKPSLFAEIEHWHRNTRYGKSRELSADWDNWLEKLPRNTAVVVEFKGDLAVRAGVELAKRGFRPVPMFNTSNGRSAAVKVGPIVKRLLVDADIIAGLDIPRAAPPAFLIDAARYPGGRFDTPGTYDNRWIVLPQDFPSARKLRSAGITHAALWTQRQGPVEEDLAHVLRRWQEDGLTVLRKVDGQAGPAAELRVPKPKHFRGLLHRMFALSGLRRNPAGGFGAVIPEPSRSSGFG